MTPVEMKAVETAKFAVQTAKNLMYKHRPAGENMPAPLEAVDDELSTAMEWLEALVP